MQADQNAQLDQEHVPQLLVTVDDKTYNCQGDINVLCIEHLQKKLALIEARHAETWDELKRT